MRIIAGEWKGRTVRAPRDARVRPTGDRAREAWMSMMQPHLFRARIADLFAGSGALGLEALSRGAAHCDFVELAESSIKMIRENIAALGAGDRATILRGDALRLAKRGREERWDVAFADPPYHLGMASKLATLWLSEPFAHILGVEHDAHEVLPPGGERRTYGSTAITLYRAHAAVDEPT